MPCHKNKKESLKTNACLEKCLEEEMEFNLPSTGRTYCIEKYYDCDGLCDICDMSSSICLKCKRDFELSNDRICRQNNSKKSNFHNFSSDIISQFPEPSQI